MLVSSLSETNASRTTINGAVVFNVPIGVGVVRAFQWERSRHSLEVNRSDRHALEQPFMNSIALWSSPLILEYSSVDNTRRAVALEDTSCLTVCNNLEYNMDVDPVHWDQDMMSMQQYKVIKAKGSGVDQKTEGGK